MSYMSFNDQDLMSQFYGDEEILIDMINLFQNRLEDMLLTLRQSVLLRDGDRLRLNAHTFKGIFSNFYSEEGRIIASKLEVCGTTKEFVHALALLNKLENLLQKFLFEIVLLKKDLA